MTDDISRIGFFQFDNLIKNRVPFVFVNLGADLASWYTGIYAQHLESCTLSCAPAEVLSQVESKQLPKHHPIVVMCEDEKKSYPVVAQLEKAGYTSAFLAEGGQNAFAQERS